VTWLLDTNVVSESIKPQPHPGVALWLSEVDEDTVYLSVVLLAEIRRGIELLPSGPRRARLTAWLDQDLIERFSSRILEVDRRVADVWGRLSASAKRQGTALSPMDAFFGATALVHGLTLVTRDTSAFEKLSVPVMDPWDYRPGSA